MRKSHPRRELERSVLSAMMASLDGTDEAARHVGEADFYGNDHRLIFSSLLAMRAAGTHAGVASLGDDLAAQGKLEEAGGLAYLQEVSDTFCSLALLEDYCGRVKDYSIRDKVKQAGIEIAELGKTRRGSVKEMLAEAEKLVYSLSEVGPSGEARTANELVDAVFRRIDQRSRGGAAGLYTGLTDLDLLLTGLHEGELIVVAARPGVGKSTVAANIAANVAKYGDPVLFSSMEMSGEELMERVVVRESRVQAQDVRKGGLTPAQASALAAAGHKARGWPIHIDDAASQGCDRIASTARRLKKRGLALVVVDYLQLLKPESKRSPRHEQVAQMARDLKNMAKSLKVPVLALSQLNRNVEGRADKTPTLADLRESGEIEQAADVVGLLHQTAIGQLDVIVAKQRNGPRDTVHLSYEPHFHLVKDV